MELDDIFEVPPHDDASSVQFAGDPFDEDVEAARCLGQGQPLLSSSDVLRDDLGVTYQAQLLLGLRNPVPKPPLLCPTEQPMAVETPASAVHTTDSCPPSLQALGQGVEEIDDNCFLVNNTDDDSEEDRTTTSNPRLGGPFSTEDPDVVRLTTLQELRVGDRVCHGTLLLAVRGDSHRRGKHVTVRSERDFCHMQCTNAECPMVIKAVQVGRISTDRLPKATLKGPHVGFNICRVTSFAYHSAGCTSLACAIYKKAADLRQQTKDFDNVYKQIGCQFQVVQYAATHRITTSMAWDHFRTKHKATKQKAIPQWMANARGTFADTEVYSFATQELHDTNADTVLSESTCKKLEAMMVSDGTIQALNDGTPNSYKRAFNTGWSRPPITWALAHQATLSDLSLRQLAPSEYVKSPSLQADYLAWGFSVKHLRSRIVKVYDAELDDVPTPIASGTSTAYLNGRVWDWLREQAEQQCGGSDLPMHLEIFVTPGTTLPRSSKQGADVLSLTDFIENARQDPTAPTECTYVGVVWMDSVCKTTTLAMAYFFQGTMAISTDAATMEVEGNYTGVATVCGAGKVRALCHSLWVKPEAPKIHPIKCLTMMLHWCGTGKDEVEMANAERFVADRLAIYLTDVELERAGLIPASSVDQRRVPPCYGDEVIRTALLIALEARPSTIGAAPPADRATIVVTDGASGLGDALINLNTEEGTNFHRRADGPHLMTAFARNKFGSDQLQAFSGLVYRATTPDLRRRFSSKLKDNVLEWCLKHFCAHKYRREQLSRHEKEQIVSEAVSPGGAVHPIQITTTGSSENVAGYLCRTGLGKEDEAVRQQPHHNAIFSLTAQFRKTAAANRDEVLEQWRRARAAEKPYLLTPYGRRKRENAVGSIDPSSINKQQLGPADRQLPTELAQCGIEVNRDPRLFAGLVEFLCQPLSEEDEVHGMIQERHVIYPLCSRDPRSHLKWTCSCGTMLDRAQYCRGVLEAAQHQGLEPEYFYLLATNVALNVLIGLGLPPVADQCTSDIPVQYAQGLPHLNIRGIRLFSGRCARVHQPQGRIVGHSGNSRIKSTVGQGSPFRNSAGAAAVARDGDTARVQRVKQHFRKVAVDDSKQTCGQCQRPGHYQSSCAGLEEEEVQHREQQVGMRLEARRRITEKTAFSTLNAKALAQLNALALTMCSEAVTGSVSVGLLQQRAEKLNITEKGWEGWPIWLETQSSAKDPGLLCSDWNSTRDTVPLQYALVFVVGNSVPCAEPTTAQLTVSSTLPQRLHREATLPLPAPMPVPQSQTSENAVKASPAKRKTRSEYNTSAWTTPPTATTDVVAQRTATEAEISLLCPIIPCTRVRTVHRRSYGGDEPDLMMAIAVFGAYVFDEDLTRGFFIAMVNPGLAGKTLKCDICAQKHIEPFDLVIRFEGQNDSHGQAKAKGIEPYPRRFAPACLKSRNTKLAKISKDVPRDQGVLWPPRKIHVAPGTIPDGMLPQLDALQAKQSLDLTLVLASADKLKFTALRRADNPTHPGPAQLPSLADIRAFRGPDVEEWRVPFMIRVSEMKGLKFAQKKTNMVTCTGLRERRRLTQMITTARATQPSTAAATESAARASDGQDWKIEVDEEGDLQIPQSCLTQCVKSLLPMIETCQMSARNPSPLKALRAAGMSWRHTLRMAAARGYENLTEAAVDCAAGLVADYFEDHIDSAAHQLHDVLLPDILKLTKGLLLRVPPNPDTLQAEVVRRKGKEWTFSRQLLEPDQILGFFSSWQKGGHLAKRTRISEPDESNPSLRKSSVEPSRDGGAAKPPPLDMTEPRLLPESCPADNLRAVCTTELEATNTLPTFRTVASRGCVAACTTELEATNTLPTFSTVASSSPEDSDWARAVRMLECLSSDDDLIHYDPSEDMETVEMVSDSDESPRSEAGSDVSPCTPTSMNCEDQSPSSPTVPFPAQRFPDLTVIEKGFPNVLNLLKVGSTVAVLFVEPESEKKDDWYVGTVIKILPTDEPGKLDAVVEYADGYQNQWDFWSESYGPDDLWVLLKPKWTKNLTL